MGHWHFNLSEPAQAERSEVAHERSTTVKIWPTTLLGPFSYVRHSDAIPIVGPPTASS
jgi:hypothetical protein